MTSNEEAVFPDMFTRYGDHYIAVNEAGDLRSKPPMWQPDRPYHEAYQRPINAGIENGHIVFFIHGGGNDVSGVIDRIQRFSDEFRGEPWHLVHLAWDTSWGAAIDDVVARLNSWDSWRNIARLSGFLLPWNWTRPSRVLRSPTRYFGDIVWRSEYETALAATSAPTERSPARARGFYRAFKYLDETATDNDGVRISFVVHSAGSIVANYLLGLIATDFRNLARRVSRYILLAPACHVTHFQDSLSAVQMAGQAAVFTLTPELEEADDIGVYGKLALWAIHDLFEAGWKREEFSRFRLPLKSQYPVGDLWNRAILGLEQQIADLESRAAYSFTRDLEGAVAWAQSCELAGIGGSPQRVWTTSQTHGAFEDEPTTVGSTKMLLR